MRSFLPNRDDLRRTVRLAAPVAFVQVGSWRWDGDIIMVGHVSATALAAAGLGNLYFFGTVMFAMGC